jgi:probable rRNA maturation factor
MKDEAFPPGGMRRVLKPSSSGNSSTVGVEEEEVAVAAKQAETAGHPMINEILLLVTHGMLHLVGFDHAEPEEEKEMFGLQKELLEKFYESESSDA